ncbi:MAG: hypothetical protein Q9193_004184 [Seirophora villosa]
MAAVAEFSKQFYDNSRTFFSERVDYTRVTALLVHWEENDIKPEEEIDAVRDLFEKDFAFATSTFRIPRLRSQQALNKEISTFVASYSNESDTLILVYYAGHGDVDNGKSIWAAYETNGPELSWGKAQQLLYDAVGDVLTIFDCCSAAVVSKGDKDGGKYEMLGASAKRVRTPEPGKSSFTSILIKHIRKRLKRAQQINVRDLHGELLESSQLTAEDPTGLRIAEWLKTHPPDGVTAVSVEALVLKARRLQGLVDQTAFPPGSFLGKLSADAQKEILYRLQALDTAMYSADRSAQASFAELEALPVRTSFQALGESVDAVCKAVETPIILDPQFGDHLELPKDALDVATVADVQDVVTLRQRLLDQSSIPSGLKLPRELIHFARGTTDSDTIPRFRDGTLRTLRNLNANQTVLVESVPYQDWCATGSRAGSDEIQEIEWTVGLLSSPKRIDYHILPCVGYIDEPVHRSYGFVYEIAADYDNTIAGPVLLRELYEIKSIVALGKRIRLARELIATLENFHRVGWVHKHISSYNVTFLPHAPQPHPQHPSTTCVSFTKNSRTNSIDLASPWLFGFDLSRHGDKTSQMREDHSQASNVYRHPDRWSKPKMKFIKAHDVYSLVST